MKEVTINISSVGFPSQFVSDAEKETYEFGLQIGQAIQYVFETQRMVLEGGAAVGTAALLAKKLEVQGQNVALIYSGNNIAEKTLRKVLDS